MSKFGAILATKRGDEEVAEPPATQKRTSSKVRVVESPAAPIIEEKGRVGRPRAKRSDPAYQQVTAYIRKDTYQAIKSILFNQEGEREFSELVEELLAGYARENKERG